MLNTRRRLLDKLRVERIRRKMAELEVQDLAKIMIRDTERHRMKEKPA